MATAGESVYYTLLVGNVTGSPAAGGSGSAATPAAGETPGAGIKSMVSGWEDVETPASKPGA